MSDVAEECWCGYLEAGKKSSPVLRDPALDTGFHDTVYLFNLSRGAILEYKLSIVESRLRELAADETDIAETLREAYQEARKGFSARKLRQLSPTPRVRRAAQPEEEEGEDFDDDVPIPIGDDDDDDIALDDDAAEEEEEDDED